MNNPNPQPNQPRGDQYAPNTPPQPQWQPPVNWPPAPRVYPAGRREVGFALVMLVFAVFLCNSVLFAGLHLGFAIAAAGVSVTSFVYLLACGHRPTIYSTVLTVLSVVIAAGFSRSDDGFVKFVMGIFLFAAVNLSLCLTARQNRRDPSGVRSLLDVPRTALVLGWGEVGTASRGLTATMKESGSFGKRTGSVLLGLAIAVPLVSVMVFLLIRADAAFEGLMDMLPDADWSEPIISLLIGAIAFLILYTRGVALAQKEKPAPAKSVAVGMNPLTVNTVLAAVCVVYIMYLLSQFAYFSGSFSGILPEGYTLAEYARRGFFEMAILCGIDLMIIWFAMGLVRKSPQAPLTTKLLCLFVGIVTVFLVVDASTKMMLYIDSFGLTRLRLLTEVIIIFLGLTSVTVCLWLFLPKLPYMKIVLVAALSLGAVTMWADVDTQVARYNVESYRSGKLEYVDVEYLSTLSSSAVPYLKMLTADPDPEVAVRAQEALEHYRWNRIDDFREWNYAASQAEKIGKEIAFTTPTK